MVYLKNSKAYKCMELLSLKHEYGNVNVFEIHLDGKENYIFNYPQDFSGIVSVYGPGSIVWKETHEEMGYRRSIELRSGVTIAGLPFNHTLSDTAVYGTAREIESTIKSILNAYDCVALTSRSPFHNLSIMRMNGTTVSSCIIVQHDYEGEINERTIKLPQFSQDDIDRITVARGHIHPQAYAYLLSIGVKRFTTNSYY